MSKVFGLILTPLAFGLAATAAPATAQTPAPAATPPAAAAPAGFTVGAIVRDTAGAEVGTVSKLDAQTVTVKTDKHEVPVPRASFTAAPNGLLFGLTRDQLNAAVDAQLAAAAAKVAVGATVTSTQGGAVGTIEAIDDQYVTVKLNSGLAVRLPRAAVGPGANGPVVALSGAELEAAAKAATPAAATPPATPPK